MAVEDAVKRERAKQLAAQPVPDELVEAVLRAANLLALWCPSDAQVEAARLRAALDAPRKTEAKIRVCQMQRMSARAWGQHEAIAKELGEDPNLATSDARTAWEWLVSQGDAAPLKTEAEIRADERDRLLCLALGSEEDDYYARDGYVAEWLRSQTQVEE